MANDAFPFQAVYDYFAHRLVTHGLPPDGGPLAFSCLVMVDKEDQVVRAEMLPIPQQMIEEGGADAIFGMVKDIMAKMAEDDPLPPFALVVGVEALTLARRVAKGTPRTAMTAHEIATSEETRHSLVLMVNRPGAQRLGMLHIDDERQVAYSPMLPGDGKLASGNEMADLMRRSDMH